MVGTSVKEKEGIWKDGFVELLKLQIQSDYFITIDSKLSFDRRRKTLIFVRTAQSSDPGFPRVLVLEAFFRRSLFIDISPELIRDRKLFSWSGRLRGKKLEGSRPLKRRIASLLPEV